HAHENRVARTAFLEAGADTFHIHPEAVISEPLFELAIFPRGPDGKDAVRLQRRMAGLDAHVVIEPFIGQGRERRRSIVHVEEDGIESARVAAHYRANIVDHDFHASIVEWMTRA